MLHIVDGPLARDLRSVDAHGAELRVCRCDTAFGPAYTAETRWGVAFSGLGEPRELDLLQLGFAVSHEPQWQRSHELLTAYIDERLPIDAALHLTVGSPFQRACYRALPAIPYGRTVSYGELAALAGKPLVARAAGTAMANTPLPFFLPCHRVICADGRLGGYGGREDIKAILLTREGALPRLGASPATSSW